MDSLQVGEAEAIVAQGENRVTGQSVNLAEAIALPKSVAQSIAAMKTQAQAALALAVFVQAKDVDEPQV